MLQREWMMLKMKRVLIAVLYPFAVVFVLLYTVYEALFKKPNYPNQFH